MSQVTFTVASSDADGWVGTSAEGSYPPVTATTVDTTGYIVPYKDGSFTTRVGLIRWNTSSLPDDANITAAVLRLYLASHFNTDLRDVTVEWYDPGTIALGDYTSTVGTNANAGVPMASFTASADMDFELENLSNISKTGFTGVRLHISGGAPSGINNAFFASFDAPETGPRLILTLGGTESFEPPPPIFRSRGG